MRVLDGGLKGSRVDAEFVHPPRAAQKECAAFAMAPQAAARHHFDADAMGLLQLALFGGVQNRPGQGVLTALLKR